MSTYDAVKDLPLEIDGYELGAARAGGRGELHAQDDRRRPARRRRGGRGEDVDYDPAEHGALPGAAAASCPFAGRAHARLVLARCRPAQTETTGAGRSSRPRSTWRCGRRGLSLGEALGREPRRHVRLLDARTALDDWLALYPDLRFKLDPTPEWTDELIAHARRPRQRRRRRPEGRVPRHGRRQPADPELYRARRGGVPGRVDRGSRADAGDRRGARAASRPDHLGRADPLVGRRRGAAVRAALPELQAVALRHARAAVRVLRRAASEHGIELYGGGQFELSVGRGQIQILASLFSADGPNDVAPGGYNASEPIAGLETSPLDARARRRASERSRLRREPRDRRVAAPRRAGATRRTSARRLERARGDARKRRSRW